MNRTPFRRRFVAASRITRRDLIVAAVAIFIAVAGLALAQSGGKPVLHSCVFNWADLKVVPTKMGERRPVCDAPTPTLTELECHITTLNPGEAPHPPHQHADEELMFIKEGTLEALQGDKTNLVTAGGIIFEASNEWHGLRNVGTNRATYFVLKFVPHDLVK
jgi:mannose-6-phosphate isomerase-like protein (cupin superfamily)